MEGNDILGDFEITLKVIYKEGYASSAQRIVDTITAAARGINSDFLVEADGDRATVTVEPGVETLVYTNLVYDSIIDNEDELARLVADAD